LTKIELSKTLEILPSSLSKVKMKTKRIQEYFDRIQNCLPLENLSLK